MSIKNKIKEQIYKLLNIRPKLMPGTDLIKPHQDLNGGTTSYFFDGVQNQKDNDFAAFSATRIIKEIKKEDRKKSIIYTGAISGAGNAIGIIETEIPLEEIVKTKKGSEVLTKMLSKEYALKKAYDRWDAADIEYDKSSTIGNFFKPTFFLGAIRGTEEFELDEQISPEANQEILDIEKRAQKDKNRRTDEDLQFDLGDSLYVGRTSCYKVQTPFKTEFCGIEKSGLKYKYKNPKLISREKQSYVYMGLLAIGRATGNDIRDSGINTVSRVVIELPDPIDKVFVENSYFAHETLAEMFEEENVRRSKQMESEYTYLGRISINEKGDYKFENSQKAPKKIREVVTKEIEQIKGRNNIVNFDNSKKMR